MLSPPRQPLWNRRRLIAAALLWIVIAYPLGAGPVVYLNSRHWLPDEALRWYLGPYISADELFAAYLDWCDELGARDAAKDAANSR